MGTETMTTIEVNGVKMEVDLRHAKRVEEIRVGARVKLLQKSDYGSPKVYSAVVIGFEPFQELPTIIVAYVEDSFSGVDLKFAYINKQNTNYDLVVAIDEDQLDLSKKEINEVFYRKIRKHNEDIRELEEKREFFNRKFKSYWEPAEAVEA